MSPTRRFVLTFVAVVYFVSWLFHVFARYAEADGFADIQTVFLMLYAVTPGLLAVLTGLFVLKSEERPAFWASAARVFIHPVKYVIALGLGVVPWLFAGFVVFLGSVDFQAVAWIGIGFAVVVAFLNELAWRGLVMARVMETRSATTATFFTGVVWGGWTLPLYVTAEGAFFPFLIFSAVMVITIATSVIYGWLYEISGRSFVITGFMQASAVMTSAMVFGFGVRADEFTVQLLGGCVVAAALYSVIAATLIARGSVSSERPSQ